jgi:beta-galactosidase
MKKLTRRTLLQSSLAAPAAAALSTVDVEAQAQSASPAPAPAAPGGPRERRLLDFGWRFHFGNANDVAQDFNFRGNFSKTGNFGPVSTPLFDDNDWKAIDLPHDWAVELPFQNDPALSSKGFYPLGRAYPATSVGWYRRLFDLPASAAGQRISLEFDGAYREAMVVVNGFYVGRHIGGYDPFRFDVTDFVNPGGVNVLLVRVDATQSDGWFYEGAGIYRHVWLVSTNPVHVKQWGTLVKMEVTGSGDPIARIRTEVVNDGQGDKIVGVTSTILDPAGKAVARSAIDPRPIPGGAMDTLASIAAGSDSREHTFEQQMVVGSPAWWSLEQRNLYKLVTEVTVEGAVVDRYETPFGIRTCVFDAERGFLLNGKPVKLKGTCNHQDHAGVGAALPDAMQYYRIRKLQEMGCNALRTSHNPPTPELLNAADELGMLVFDETRMMSSNPEGLSQFENLVRRDRNHPSVFLWSMGNEEGTAGTDRGLLILTAMKEVAMRQDGSRLVSIAPNGGNNMGKFGFAACDVQGYNYADPQADAFHQANPKVPVMGTEQVSAVATRGIYVMDAAHGYVGSYDPWTTTGRASCEGWWSFCNARPWLAGGFIWTGFDYRGEPSPYQWPNISSQYGIIDTCGFPKDSFFYFQAWWTSQPRLHLFPHWNWPGLEGQEIAVWVYSNLERVELFHNGQSLGAKDMKKDSHLAWNVKYAPGTIEARGFRGGRQVMTAKRETTGAAAKLAMTPDRREVSADGEDTLMFAVEVQDARGRTAPLADNQVTFRINGPGRLIGVGNGDPTSHESDKGSARKAFCGLAMALVQSTKAAGEITVEASSPGLAAASVRVSSKAVKLRPQVPVWEREVPSGPGVTGLWRPASGAAMQVFTLRQNGSALTGTVEGGAGPGGGAPAAIQDGKVEGAAISFRAGNATYTGSVTGDRIELQPAFAARGGRGGAPAAPAAAGPRPAIGPPPDGTDPSRGAFIGGGGGRGQQGPLVLKKVGR